MPMSSTGGGGRHASAKTLASSGYARLRRSTAGWTKKPMSSPGARSRSSRAGQCCERLLACDRCADLDQHPLQVTHVGDGLTSRFRRGRGDDDCSGRERCIPGRGNIVRDEANLDTDRWLRQIIATVTAGDELPDHGVVGK